MTRPTSRSFRKLVDAPDALSDYIAECLECVELGELYYDRYQNYGSTAYWRDYTKMSEPLSVLIGMDQLILEECVHSLTRAKTQRAATLETLRSACLSVDEAIALTADAETRQRQGVALDDAHRQITETVLVTANAIEMFVERYLQLMPETRKMLTERCDVFTQDFVDQRNALAHFESVAFQIELESLKDEARARLEHLPAQSQQPAIDLAMLFRTLDDPRLEQFTEAASGVLDDLETLRVIAVECEARVSSRSNDPEAL